MQEEMFFIVISLIFSAIFSATEIAFVSANRLHFAVQKKKGNLNAAILDRFIQKPTFFITAMLIGNTISLVIYGIYMAKILDIPIAQFVQTYFALSEVSLQIMVLVIQSILSTLLVLAVAEFLPKSLAMISPDKYLERFILLIQIIYKILQPFVYLTVVSSKFILEKIFRQPYQEIQPVFGLTDLNHYISNLRQDSAKTDVDAKIFSNAVEFKFLKVRDCMIPRTDIFAIDKTDTIEELQNAFVESGHSKIIVFDQSIDNVIGYCHCLEIFKKPKGIENIISPLSIVPESMPANELMLQFISENRSIALVVDEFGGTSGLVTIEDVMEEIFGEIDDEYDEVNEAVQIINDYTFVVNARTEIDDLNEKYNWNIPDGDYETLGGYLIALWQSIPELNSEKETDNFIFKVVSKKENRVDFIELTLKNKNGNKN